MVSNVPSSNEYSADDCCPNCGADELYREPMCVHGGPMETTSGIACDNCHWHNLDS